MNPWGGKPYSSIGPNARGGAMKSAVKGASAAIAVMGAVLACASAPDTVLGSSRAVAADPLNATYVIEGQAIALVDGRSELPAAPGSATKIRTAVFGKPVYGDLDGDGDEDAALLLVHDLGGSGTFLYVAAALNDKGRYRGTNAVLLGDRVAVQNVAIQNAVVIANYADRRPQEPMSAAPSVAKLKYLTLQDGRLEEIRPPAQALRGGRGDRGTPSVAVPGSMPAHIVQHHLGSPPMTWLP